MSGKGAGAGAAFGAKVLNELFGYKNVTGQIAESNSYESFVLSAALNEYTIARADKDKARDAVLKVMSRVTIVDIDVVKAFDLFWEECFEVNNYLHSTSILVTGMSNDTSVTDNAIIVTAVTDSVGTATLRILQYTMKSVAIGYFVAVATNTESLFGTKRSTYKTTERLGVKASNLQTVLNAKVIAQSIASSLIKDGSL